MKRILPAIAAVVCGVIALVDFFLPNPQIDALGAALVEGVTILAAFALLLGVANILGVHARRIVARPGTAPRGSNRLLSLVLVLSLLATLAVGILRPAAPAMRWIFGYVYEPLQATMMALLAFFAISAAYRAFRLRNTEALILTLTTLVLLLVQWPLSAPLASRLAIIREWLLTVPVAGGMRGILIGMALGSMATALRLLFLVDRPYS